MSKYLYIMKFQRKQKEIVERFVNIYEAEKGYRDIGRLVKDFDFQTLLNMTAEEYLKDLGINNRFSQEILQSATRGNYCQDLNALHALAVMVNKRRGDIHITYGDV